MFEDLSQRKCHKNPILSVEIKTGCLNKPGSLFVAARLINFSLKIGCLPEWDT